jgi:nickel-dependent lactate racemase
MSETTKTSYELRFGSNKIWELPASEQIQSYLGVPASAEATDSLTAPLSTRVDKALRNPIEFPSMDQLTVSGDIVAFAIDPLLPNPIELVPEIIQWFAEQGTSPANMRVVYAGDSSGCATRLRQRLVELLGSDLEFAIHDPNETEALAYVAADEAAEPIYINRTLVDADVVVPIRSCRPAGSIDDWGPHALYPLLTDQKTRQRFLSPESLWDKDSHGLRIKWCDEAANWAGWLTQILALPSIPGAISAVFAGLCQPVHHASQSQFAETWETPIHEASLTIALLDGNEEHQDWLGLARALRNADRVTADGGNIVVCTEISTPLGKALRSLRASAGNADELEQSLNKTPSADSLAASLIHRIKETKHMYLVSQLKSDTVESIGLGAIENSSQLQHLVAQHDSVNLVSSIQHRHFDVAITD